MAEEYRIDSHKLIYHPRRVADWLEGQKIYPLSVEISPSSACNHRCLFCSFDYLDYKPIFLDYNLIITNLKQMAGKGLKSVVLAGQGEPLLNPQTPNLIEEIRSFNLDIGMSTNGVLFKKEFSQRCLGLLKWVRFSLNAGSSETHQLIHKGKSNDFDIVLNNIADAVEEKRIRKLDTTIGVQLLLIPENADEVLELAIKLKDIGVDYFTVKPYYQHPSSINVREKSFDEKWCRELQGKLQALANASYQVYFRMHTMTKLLRQKNYDVCRALPFWTCIDAEANVWSCLSHIGNTDYLYGNLKEKSFSAIWESEQRENVLKRITSLGVDHCQEACRLDEMNIYLHEICNLSSHVNFI